MHKKFLRNTENETGVGLQTAFTEKLEFKICGDFEENSTRKSTLVLEFKFNQFTPLSTYVSRCETYTHHQRGHINAQRGYIHAS
jgi:hypothetical protein